MVITVDPPLTTTEPPHLATTDQPHLQADALVMANEAAIPEQAPLEGSMTVKRRSVRPPARQCRVVDPVAHARDVKIKNLGMTAEDVDSKAIKKRQLLQAHTDEAGDAADAAVHDLLGIQARPPSTRSYSLSSCLIVLVYGLVSQ
jgi:hypothetical protein